MNLTRHTYACIIWANFDYEANTTAGNGNYFVNLLNILLKNSREKLVKLQDVNLFLADFLSFESTVGYNSLETRPSKLVAISFLLCSIQQPFSLLPMCRGLSLAKTAARTARRAGVNAAVGDAATTHKGYK